MEPVEKREEFKIVEIKGRKFRVEKFDALTGSYLVYQLLNLALPPIAGTLLAQSGLALPSAEATGHMMTKEEFGQFQKDCLSVCSEVLPAGNAPVIDANGNFGVIGLEKDMATVLRLTIESILFNALRFFEEGGLSEFLPSFAPSN